MGGWSADALPDMRELRGIQASDCIELNLADGLRMIEKGGFQQPFPLRVPLISSGLPDVKGRAALTVSRLTH